MILATFAVWVRKEHTKVTQGSETLDWLLISDNVGS